MSHKSCDVADAMVACARFIRSRISKDNGGVLGRSGMVSDLALMQELVDRMNKLLPTLPEGS